MGNILLKETRMAGMLLFFLLFSSLASAQHFFYFENQFIRDSLSAPYFYSFVIVHDDGTATVRLRYPAPAGSNDYWLAELSLVDSVMEENKNDPTTKYLVAKNPPQIIMGESEDGFVMPRYVFSRQEMDDGNTYYEPIRVEFKNPDGSWETKETVKWEQRGWNNLSDNFVRLFYSTTDPFYTLFYEQTAVESTGRDNNPRKEKLYLVVVANTKDSAIGKSTQKDFDNITDIFTSLTTDLKMKLVTYYIKDADFGLANVNNTLRKLKPAPIDIIVFYYSGHGFRYSNDVSKYPRMSLRQKKTQNIDLNNLGLEAVYKKLLTKKARVTIVIGDCCNDNIGSEAPVGRELLRTRGARGVGSSNYFNYDNCESLFFPAKPVSVLVGSASVNQLAAGNPALGGFFTNFFTKGIYNCAYNPGTNGSWLGMLIDVQKKASYQSLSALCGADRCVQRAETLVDPPQ